MKSIRTLALVTGLLALSGVSQAQFSSTWTFVTDYDFRGLQPEREETRPSRRAPTTPLANPVYRSGIWASNVDFGVDDDLETDYYVNYVGQISEKFAFTAGVTYYDYPLGDGLSGYPEGYVGLNFGGLSFKQWYSNDFYALDETAQYSELNFTQSIRRRLLDRVARRLFVGRLLGCRG